MKCTKCDGNGWYIDHSDRHYGTGDSESCEQAGCPVQRQCEECQGTGEIPDQKETAQKWHEILLIS